MSQVLANGLTASAVYVLVALGFGLIYFTTEHFHLAHGAVVTLGAYAGYTAMSLPPHSVTLAAFVAAATGAVAGCAMEWAVYRPFVRRAASGEVILIASLSVYFLVINVIALFSGNETKLLRTGAARTFLIGEAVVTSVQLVQVATAAGLGILLAAFLARSSVGRKWRAVADDGVLAGVIGLNTNSIRLAVFATGSTLAAIGGFLVALDVGINPHMGFHIVVAAIVSCIVGGMGRYLAPILGGLILGITQAVVVDMLAARWKAAVTYVLLLLFLALRPQGILGRARRVEEA